MKKDKNKTNKLEYVPENQNASTKVLRWNLCQQIMTRVYHSEISTADLIRVADEPQTTKALGFVTRRIAGN